MEINFKKLDLNAQIPSQNKPFDAGYDLRALEDCIIQPFERKLVKTGIAVEIPVGYYGRVAPRSGLALKNGIDVLAGVIDASYRDGIGVVLINFDVLAFLHSLKTGGADAITSYFGIPGAFKINAGDRIAQLIIEPCMSVNWVEKDGLSSTERGVTGFGNSGVR